MWGGRIEDACTDVRAAGVADRGAGGRVDRRADRHDGLAFNQDVGAPQMIMVHDGTAADDKAGHGNSEPAIRKRVTLAVSAARWSLKSRATSPLVASEPRADDEWRADNDGEALAVRSVLQRRQQFVGTLGHHHVAGAAQDDGS